MREKREELPCGCVVTYGLDGRWLACGDHIEMCPKCGHDREDHTAIGCWAKDCHCSLGHGDGEWML